MAAMENTTSQAEANSKLREQFIQNLKGSTMEDVMSFLSQVPLFVFITLFIELCILNRVNIGVLRSGSAKLYNAVAPFIVEYLSIVVPLVFLFTSLSDSVHLVFLCLAAAVFSVMILSVSSPQESVLYWRPNFKGLLFSDSFSSGKEPFITYFRSLTFLVTSISILGVDFHAYPRRFAKTETYGVSLMDIGVGLFVFSNSIVVNTSTLLNKELKKTFLEGLVFLVLGVIRYFLVQHLDYQKHVTEYGTHWNFFITMALLKIASHVIFKLSRGHSFACGLVLMLVHQYGLNIKLESYVLSDLARNNWLSANREGVVSLCGYVALYLMGITIGNVVNPSSRQPSFGIVKNKPRIFGVLVAASMTLFGLLYWFEIKQIPVSRRLANLPYVIWVIAVGVTLLAITLLMELLSLCFLPVQQHFRSKLYSKITPVLLECINFNGLAFFLTSNILTGLINLSIDVFSLETYPSMVVLLSYMFVNCASMYLLYLWKIQIKLW